jgi:enoyl-CoA hydratase
MGERGGTPENETPVASSRAQVEGIAAVYQATKPIIAAINGYAYGGGARLAVSTDIRLASTTAKIRFVSVSYGLVACGTELPPIVGTAMAKELIYTARVVEAEEAERIGLVNHVYPPEELMPAAIEMAKQIAANSPQAVQWAKKVINAASTIEKGLEVEIEARQASSRSEDHDTRFREAAARVTGREA